MRSNSLSMAAQQIEDCILYAAAAGLCASARLASQALAWQSGRCMECNRQLLRLQLSAMPHLLHQTTVHQTALPCLLHQAGLVHFTCTLLVHIKF